MKTSNKIFLGLFALISLNVLTGAIMLRGSLQPQGIGDGEKRIEGNNVLKTNKIEVVDFSKLTIDGNYEVVLSQGEEFIEIKTSENLIDLFTTKKTEDGRLILTAKEGYSLVPKQSIQIKLGFKSLTEIDIAGSTTITAVDTLQFENLQLNHQDFSKSKLIITANKNLNVWAKDMAEANLAGHASKTRIELADVAKLHADKLVLQKVDIQTRDMSFANINVVQQIKGHSADNSTIEYIGQPKGQLQDRDMSRIIKK